MKRVYFFIGLFVLGFSSEGYASGYDWGTKAKVHIVEGTYMPIDITFSVKSTTTENPCFNSWLHYKPQGSSQVENINAIYSGLLGALYSQKTIQIYGLNDCTVKYVHFLSE